MTSLSYLKSLPGSAILVTLACLQVDAQTAITIRDTVIESAKTASVPDSVVDTIEARAARAMKLQLVSVTDDDHVAASGDVHDFMCPAPLWWPDPDRPNGLPYVWNREGQINPEYYQIGDCAVFDEMAGAVADLATAFLVTGEERFAERAADHVRFWFLNPESRMNPNLKHAWFERGRNDGTAFGIKATEKLPRVLDAIAMISYAVDWTVDDRAAMERWLHEYLGWLQTSETGVDAGRIWNRFGTIHDVQLAASALFVGDTTLARSVVESAKMDRIDRHIRRDGRQPYALEREITFANSVENVAALFQLATIGERVGADLWYFEGPGGGSIKKALDFVAPYADSGMTWPYILEVKRDLLRPVLQQAALVYDDDTYLRLVEKLRDTPETDPLYDFYAAEVRPSSTPTRLFLHPLEMLEQARQQLEPADTRLDILRQEGDAALNVPVTSVMDKGMVPPSGDKHDFMSIGGYYWPDTTKADGLPWIYRDGKVNPERSKFGDSDRFFAMQNALPKLGIAYFITRDERYARHAARLIRTWFIDPATAMNANVRYSHAQPGVMEGSYYGIIQTRLFPDMIDAIGMISLSRHWTDDDQRRMQQWAAAFLDWMLNDDDAQEAGRVWNNHSVNYDATAVSLALYVGRRGTARRILESCKSERIDRQIRPDGRLPFELERNRAWLYTTVTVERFVRLADMGRHVGVDLWNYESEEGAGIKEAIDFLARYADPSQKWPYADMNFEEQGSRMLARLRPILERAAIAYDDTAYLEISLTLPVDDVFRRSNLVHDFYPLR